MGLVIGILFFILIEDGNYSNSFMNKCWVRHQPEWIVHSKVYLIAVFLIYKGYQYQDMLLTILVTTWVGVHLSQDIAERIHEMKFGKQYVV